MKYRDLTAILREAGFVACAGKGDHEKWSHGSSMVVITRTREVSPGLVRKALQAVEKAKEQK